MLSCRAVVPIMEAQGGGSIINISSISSLRHLNVPTAVYAAAKGGLNEFSKNIALQHAPKGVRVNCVLPGYIDTPFIRRKIGSRPNYEIKGFKSAEEYGLARNDIIPMRRMGTAWDVAYACLFLASKENLIHHCGHYRRRWRCPRDLPRRLRSSSRRDERKDQTCQAKIPRP